MSAKRKGSKHSKETIEKMKKNVSGSGNGMFGKKHSEETRKKISQVLKNSEKRKLATKLLAEKLRGRKVPKEISKKISKALKGKSFTEEHKKNMRNFRWMSIDRISKKVKTEEIDLHLSLGWKIGRTQKNSKN